LRPRACARRSNLKNGLGTDVVWLAERGFTTMSQVFVGVRPADTQWLGRWRRAIFATHASSNPYRAMAGQGERKEHRPL
jgi:hypothetical protein